MKVALLGANGQLGSDLIKTVPKGIKLFPLTRKEVDVRNKEAVSKILKSLSPHVVLNTTAYVKVDLAEDEIEEAFSVNAIGVKNLVDVCKETGAALVHISTDYVFDGKKLEKREPYYEDDLPNPINIYGISKYTGELIVKNYLDKYYIIRVASLYGRAGASGKGGNFVYTILRKAKAGEPLRVIDNIYMSPTYTLDAAKEIWRIILKGRPYGIYHVTNSGYCSWYEFAKKILEYSGLKTDIKPVRHTEFKTKANRPLWSPLASKKGIKLRSWEEALKDFINDILVDNISS